MLADCKGGRVSQYQKNVVTSGIRYVKKLYKNGLPYILYSRDRKLMDIKVSYNDIAGPA